MDPFFPLLTSPPSPYLLDVTNKSARITTLVEQYRQGHFDPHYTGFFNCFNRQLFYEAHDVLENLWLRDKYGPNGNFYKGLIQLAGAYVHLQKNRLRPSAALFKLARTNLEKYPACHEYLNVETVLRLINDWLAALEANAFEKNPLTPGNVPALALEPVA